MIINRMLDCCYDCFIGQHTQKRSEDVPLPLKTLVVEIGEQLKEGHKSALRTQENAYASVTLSRASIALSWYKHYKRLDKLLQF